MARHRREPTPARRRLLVATAATVAAVGGGVVVAGGLDSVTDRTGAAAPEGTATTSATETTGPTETTQPTETTDPTPRAAAGTSVDERTDRPDQPEPQSPPPTKEAPGFLAATDLPEVPGIRGDWVGTRPVDARRDIAASLCDIAPFSTAGVTQEQTRTYVVPDEKLSPSFGLSQTLGRFATPPAADRFLEQVRERVASCEQRVSSASVNTSDRVRSPELSAGTRWTLSFDVGQRAVRYRLGVVRVGDRLAQILFSPSDRYDITPAAFDRLLVRAGERLRELGSD